jgi:hypothetical protein
LIGFFQKSVLSLNGSLIFDRAVRNDRAALTKRMKQHVNDPSQAPLLIFPEVLIHLM